MYWEPVPPIISLDGATMELLRKPRLFIRVLLGLLLFSSSGPFFSLLADRTLFHDFVEELLRRHTVLILQFFRHSIRDF